MERHIIDKFMLIKIDVLIAMYVLQLSESENDTNEKDKIIK